MDSIGEHRLDAPGGASPERGQVRWLNRRRFLAGSASMLASGTAAWFLGQAEAADAPQSSDPMLVPGSSPRPYGTRSPFETAIRLTGQAYALTPLQDLQGIITPASLHFERHHNGVPAINPSDHRLLI